MKQPTSQIHISDIKKKSLQGAISYFLRTIILQLIGIVSILVLSAYFKPEDFGVYGFVVQVVGLLIFFSDVGLAAALIQKKDEPSVKDYRTTFTIQQLLSWVVVMIALIVSQLSVVEQKIGDAGFWILLSLAVSFPLASLKTIPSVMLERKLLFSKLVIPQIFEQLIFHGLLIVLAIQGFGAIAYAYAIFARSIIGVVSMCFLQKWEFGFALDKKSLKNLLGFGFKFQLNDFLARIKDQLFYLALGLFLPIREFGYIQWAKNWSLYPYNLTVQNVMAITFPTFARLQHNKDALRKAIETSLFFITFAIFPILVGMSIFIVPFITIFTVYQKWTPAIISLIFFTLSVGWSAISSPLTNALSAIGQINKTLKLMVMWTVLTWGLTPLAMYIFGFNGVAVSALLIGCSSYLTVLYVQDTITFNFIDQVWRQVLASVIMAFFAIIGLKVWEQNILYLLLGIVSSGVCYITVFMLCGKHKLSLELKRIGLVIPGFNS